MSTNETWMPSGIDYTKALKEFRDFDRQLMTEAEFVQRIESCRDCSLCRLSKCLITGSCVGRLCRTPAKACPKKRWAAIDPD